MDLSAPRALELIARCPLFAGLPQADLRALAALAVERCYEGGAPLFWEHDPPDGLHVIQSGAVKVYKLAPGGDRELILSVERPGQAVAELSVFDGRPHPVGAAALERTTTLFLPKDRLEALFEERPGVSRHLLRAVGIRYRRLLDLVEALSFRHVVGRFAAHLLERSAEGVPFTLETNAMIAARLGTVRELVTRTLARFVAGGLVQLKGRTVVALDRGGLEVYAKGEATGPGGETKVVAGRGAVL